MSHMWYFTIPTNQVTQRERESSQHNIDHALSRLHRQGRCHSHHHHVGGDAATAPPLSLSLSSSSPFWSLCVSQFCITSLFINFIIANFADSNSNVCHSHYYINYIMSILKIITVFVTSTIIIIISITCMITTTVSTIVALPKLTVLLRSWIIKDWLHQNIMTYKLSKAMLPSGTT